jgi:hypothetical protein
MVILPGEIKARFQLKMTLLDCPGVIRREGTTCKSVTKAKKLNQTNHQNN